MSKRNDELLAMAADAFADMRNPFDTASLVEHAVTLDECGDLSESIATIIRGYLACPKEMQMQIRVAYAFAGSGLDPKDAINALQMNSLLKKLGK